MHRHALSGTALSLLFALGACGAPQSASPATGGAVAEAGAEAGLPDGVTLVERVTASDAEDGTVVIPYSKYRLDNGLTVILHEDDSDPLVHVDVTYHVGSAREELGRSGFAHFFEHMMFQGSENVADEEHFKIISESGGTLNGTTNSDRTNYFQTVPSNQLETVLWLEADRMGYFLDAVTQEKFEVQRETVKNERGQNYDNRPYGLVREKIAEALYPEGHPYSWLTIGYIEDLNKADLDDLKAFFLRWYGPNNAALTIGGDVDKAQTLEWVAKYFGPIPEGPAVEDAEPQPPTLQEDRYLSYEDRVSLPLLAVTYPTVHRFHPDEAPLDVLAEILGQGATSIMYANLVKDGRAVQASASHPCAELACTFSIFTLPNPASGTTLADLDDAVRASIAEFETRGVRPDDLERVKAGIRSGSIYGLESVSGKVSQLASYETFRGDADFIGKDIARYEAVTAEDVMRVYETYIKDKPAVYLSVVPEGQPDAAARPDTWTFDGRTLPDAFERTELALRRGEDNFDRSERPVPGAAPLVSVPAIYEAELGNGVPVLGAVNDEVPTTAVRIRIPRGQRSETLATLGLASLTADMMDEATEAYTKEELQNALAKLGSSVSVSSGQRYTTVTLRSLTDNLEETAAIAADILFRPAFDEESFARVKDQTLEGIRQGETQASGVAWNVFNLLLSGDTVPSAYSGLGTEETVSELTLDDVRRFYSEELMGAGAQITAVSSLPQDALLDALLPFEAIEGGAGETVTVELGEQTEPGPVYFVDMPGAAQSEIRIGRRALPYDATGRYYLADIANYVLGGAFNSRININLREDKGWTYGARSGFSGGDTTGTFTAFAGVKRDNTGDAIREFLSEIADYAEGGPTEEELAFTKAALGQRDARSFETPFQKLGLIGLIQSYDLDPGYIDEQKRILESVDGPALRDAVAEFLDPEDMLIVVVGDGETVRPQLEALGRPVVELAKDAGPAEG